MLDLIKRLEEETGPITASKEMEALIRASPWYANTPSSDPIWGYFVRALGGSIDAAVALAERVLSNERPFLARIAFEGKYQWRASFVGGIVSWAPTPALALCIAILKAKEASNAQ